MSNPNSSAGGADWTKLLSDPELVSHLGKLLQAYREASPEKRDQALRDALREIKASKKMPSASAAEPVTSPTPTATAPAATPPFEPDIFTPNRASDRRRYPRVKCFVAVELGVEGSPTPVWGNLVNTSRGGCLVETATPVKTGVKLEIGLWVANGKLWVKGMILNGVVTKSNPCFGVRIKFDELEPNERETLRQFLRFIESTTQGYSDDHGYLAQLKR